MNKKKYIEFINRLNNLLKINSKNINFVGLSFLHVIRPQYDLIKHFNNFDIKYRFYYHIRITLIKLLFAIELYKFSLNILITAPQKCGVFYCLLAEYSQKTRFYSYSF